MNFEEAHEKLERYLETHPETLFIAKTAAVIAAAWLVRLFLVGGSTYLFVAYLLIPGCVLGWIMTRAAMTDRKFLEVLGEYVTILNVPYVEAKDRYEDISWVTYSIVAVCVVVYYFVQPLLGDTLIAERLIFVPLSTGPGAMVSGLLASMFLHGSGGHLWGNMMFLWATGTVVEKRVGSVRFLYAYLLSGVIASLFSFAAYAIFGETVHGLGASGAIAGVMGVFMVRCYYKTMVVPLPILGLFSLLIPVGFKVRMSSLSVMGFFFLLDLRGGLAQARQLHAKGFSFDHIAHWAHIGGMLAGIALALRMKLPKAAADERHFEIGMAVIRDGVLSEKAREEGFGREDAERSLRHLLEGDPGNGAVMLQLARVLSYFSATDEGKLWYRKAIARLTETAPTEVVPAFTEYYRKYMDIVDPAVQIRVAGLLHKEGLLDLSARTLEMVSEAPGETAELRAHALYRSATILEDMGLPEAANACFRKCVERFPDSTSAAKAAFRPAKSSGK